MKALWRLSVLCVLCTCVIARHHHGNQQRLRQVLQQRRQRKLTTSKLLKWCYQKIGNVTLKWCKFKIHCGNKIEIEISFEKGGLSLLYQMSESFCLWDRFSLSFFFYSRDRYWSFRMADNEEWGVTKMAGKDFFCKLELWNGPLGGECRKGTLDESY